MKFKVEPGKLIKVKVETSTKTYESEGVNFESQRGDNFILLEKENGATDMFNVDKIERICIEIVDDENYGRFTNECRKV